jgi:hypothetical protein
VTLGGDNVVSELQPGDPQTIGPYRLVGQLGQGGMGRVYLGVSPGGRPVAVKAIRAELAADGEFRRRFGREVAAARRVSGVFTAQVVDADIDGPVAWMATAYVPGPSLAEAVETHGPLPETSLLALAAGLAESLNAIHAAGVVHRDLKPSNVLLAEDGPRVIDFGISRAAETTALTQAGLVVGSPGFMSPEQAMGHDVGPASDIFNLGAVLAYAATGQGPFGTGTTAALLYRVVHGTPTLDGVPPTVRPLIERCLAKDPAQRPTAAGLLAEVGAMQPAGDWLPESLTRTFAAGSVSGFRPAPSGPGFAPSGPRSNPAGPGLAAAGFAGAAAGAGLAAPGPGSAAPGPGSAAPVPGSAAPGAPPGSGLGATRTTAPGPGAQPSTRDNWPQVAAGAGLTATAGSAPPPYGGTYPPQGVLLQPPPGGPKRPRRRLLRPLVLAWILVALIAVGGGTAFAVTSFTGNAPSQIQPAGQTSSPTASTSYSQGPSGVSASPSASAGTSTPASPSSYASTSAPPTAPSSSYTPPTTPTSPSTSTSTSPTTPPTSSSPSTSSSAPSSSPPSYGSSSGSTSAPASSASTAPSTPAAASS